MSNSNLDQAREWAEVASAMSAPGRAQAAAEIIKSLPDQWIDAEKLREALDGWSLAGKALRETDLGKRLEALLPANLPTLADMTTEERISCQFMQARIEDGTRGIIVHPGDLRSNVILEGGGFYTLYNEDITPLHGEPKLKWPGSERPALPEGMRLADHEEYGRVVVSPGMDNDGDYKAYYSDPGSLHRADWEYVHENSLTFLGGEKQ